jgi:hypothetical protein
LALENDFLERALTKTGLLLQQSHDPEISRSGADAPDGH